MLLKAMRLPSGDQAGMLSSAELVVRRVWEAPAEVKPLDACAHGRGAAHVREQLRRLVDRGHRMAEAKQVVCHAPDAAAELEDLSARVDGVVHALRLAEGR